MLLGNYIQILEQDESCPHRPHESAFPFIEEQKYKSQLPVTFFFFNKRGIMSLLAKDINIAARDMPQLADASNCPCSLHYTTLSLQHRLQNAVKTLEAERRYSEGKVTYSHTIT